MNTTRSTWFLKALVKRAKIHMICECKASELNYKFFEGLDIIYL